MAGLSHFERIGGGRDSDQLVTDSGRPGESSAGDFSCIIGCCCFN